MLAGFFRKNVEINCIQSKADANIEICTAALSLTEGHPVVIHSEDTDLLVILIHYDVFKENPLHCMKLFLLHAIKKWDIIKTVAELPEYL